MGSQPESEPKPCRGSGSAASEGRTQGPRQGKYGETEVSYDLRLQDPAENLLGTCWGEQEKPVEQQMCPLLKCAVVVRYHDGAGKTCCVPSAGLHRLSPS